LVFKKQTVSIKQLQYVMSRDFDDFTDLTEADSDISKIITSQIFVPANLSEEEKVSSDDHM